MTGLPAGEDEMYAARTEMNLESAIVDATNVGCFYCIRQDPNSAH